MYFLNFGFSSIFHSLESNSKLKTNSGIVILFLVFFRKVDPFILRLNNNPYHFWTHKIEQIR